MDNKLWVGGGALVAVGIVALVIVLFSAERKLEPDESRSAMTEPATETWVEVLARHPGSALELERTITRRIEERCAGTRGLLGTRSLTWSGGAKVILRFASAGTAHAALDPAGPLLDELRGVAPGAELLISTTPVDGLRTYVLTGAVGRGELTDIAKDVADGLSLVSGVDGVVRIGDLRPEAVVTVDATALLGRGLSPSRVVAAVAKVSASLREEYASKEDPDRRSRGRELLSLLGDVVLGDVVLGGAPGRPVLLRDVADLRLAFSHDRGHAMYRGHPAVVLQVATRANPVSDLLHEVQEHSGRLPEPVRIVAWDPQPTSTVVDLDWDAPAGTPWEGILDMSARLERAFLAAHVDDSIVWVEGGETGPEHRGRAFVELQRGTPVREVIGTLGGIPGLNMRRMDVRGPAGRRSFVLDVRATDLGQLQPLAIRVGQTLLALRGILMVTHDAPTFEKTLSLKVDQIRTSQLGLAGEEVLSQAKFGQGGCRVAGPGGMPIWIRPTHEARGLSDILLQVGDRQVPLSQVAKVSLLPKVGRIRHVDGRRTAIVTAVLATGAQRESVLQAARTAIAQLGLPRDTVRWEDTETRR